METLLNIVFLLSGMAVFPAFLVSILSTNAVAKHLARDHPQIWSQIAPVGGQPSLSSPFSRFITQRRYLEVKDPALQILGDRARRQMYWAVSIFMVVLLSGLSQKLIEQL